jgi:hypothetical protein
MQASLKVIVLLFTLTKLLSESIFVIASSNPTPGGGLVELEKRRPCCSGCCDNVDPSDPKNCCAICLPGERRSSLLRMPERSLNVNVDALTPAVFLDC